MQLFVEREPTAMLSVYQQSTTNEFMAVLFTLKKCIEQCPEDLWFEPVVNLKYCQVVFHSLFFTDVYLGPNLAALREQSFHRDNPDFFGDYEKLEDRLPARVYDTAQMEAYVQHCADKAHRVIAHETQAQLATAPGFGWLQFSRAEVHISSIRHLQHHAAQLSLHLNQKTGVGVDWVRSGAE